MTMVVGSGMRSSASPSRRGFGSTGSAAGIASSSGGLAGGVRRALDRGEQRGQAAVDVRAEVHAQYPPPAPYQHLQIAQRLRVSQGGEAVALAGDRQIGGRVGGDLQEHAVVGAALVQLPGRVQEARAVADGGGVAAAIA